MATPAQIAANRRNAQKSTGPRTAEGKKRSSQNAFKHGLSARNFDLYELIDQRVVEMQHRVLTHRYQPKTERQQELLKLLAEKMCPDRAVGTLETRYFQSITRMIRPKSTSVYALDRIGTLAVRTKQEITDIRKSDPELFARDKEPISGPKAIDLSSF